MPPSLLLRVGCCAGWMAVPVHTDWIVNSATSAEDALVVESSGENLACANNAWKAVDGVMGFGCDGATPGTTGRPVAGWNAGPSTANAVQFLVLDFKRAVTLSALRYTGGGDKVHDADEMAISVGATAKGPWTQIGAPFHGKAGDGKPNTWNDLEQAFDFPSSTAQFWRWDITTRHSEWQVWVGEVQFFEVSNWGWYLVGALLAATASYVGCGYIYNTRSKGMAHGAAALPHRHFWLDVAGLVQDGIQYSRERLNGTTHSGRSGGRSGSTASGGARLSSRSGCGAADRDTLLQKARAKKDKQQKKSGKKDKGKTGAGSATIRSSSATGANPGYGAASTRSATSPPPAGPAASSSSTAPGSAGSGTGTGTGTAAGDGALRFIEKCFMQPPSRRRLPFRFSRRHWGRDRQRLACLELFCRSACLSPATLA